MRLFLGRYPCQGLLLCLIACCVTAVICQRLPIAQVCCCSRPPAGLAVCKLRVSRSVNGLWGSGWRGCSQVWAAGADHVKCLLCSWPVFWVRRQTQINQLLNLSRALLRCLHEAQSQTGSTLLLDKELFVTTSYKSIQWGQLMIRSHDTCHGRYACQC